MTNERPMDCSSGKRWFRHKSDVHARIGADEREFGYKMKAYQCAECGWWHKAKVRHNGLPVLLLDFIRRNRGSE